MLYYPPSSNSGSGLSVLQNSTPGLSAIFQPPSGAKFADIILIGGGGSGGSGRKNTATFGITASGGGGGSGGMLSKSRYELAALASVLGITAAGLWLQVEIGAGGALTPGVTTASTNGTLGQNGGISRLICRDVFNSTSRTFMQAGSGFGGQPGSTSGSTSGGNVPTFPGTFPGGAGGFGSNGNAGNGGASNSGPSGGGGGAGQATTAWINRTGGTGGQAAGADWGLMVPLPAFGVPPSTTIPAGVPGAGGRGGNSLATGVGVSGDNGFRGGGGGGGGASGGGFPSGAGGKGGDGYLYILWS